MAKEPSPAAKRPLIDIEGVGPEYAAKLKAAGYHNMDDLLVPSTDEIVEKTGISSALVRVWQSMADLDRLETINNQYAELLVRSRFTTIEQIAQAPPEEIVRATAAYVATLKRAPTTQPVNEAMASEWIREARRFPASHPQPVRTSRPAAPAPPPAAAARPAPTAGPAESMRSAAPSPEPAQAAKPTP